MILRSLLCSNIPIKEGNRFYRDVVVGSILVIHPNLRAEFRIPINYGPTKLCAMSSTVRLTAFDVVPINCQFQIFFRHGQRLGNKHPMLTKKQKIFDVIEAWKTPCLLQTW